MFIQLVGIRLKRKNGFSQHTGLKIQVLNKYMIEVVTKLDTRARNFRLQNHRNLVCDHVAR